jgi:hypothetical protein
MPGESSVEKLGAGCDGSFCAAALPDSIPHAIAKQSPATRPVSGRTGWRNSKKTGAFESCCGLESPRSGSRPGSFAMVLEIVFFMSLNLSLVFVRKADAAARTINARLIFQPEELMTG